MRNEFGMPENFGRDEYIGQTTLHPIGLMALIVLGVALLLVPKRWSTLPMIIMACFIPASQRIVILTFNFDFLRIMVLFGWIRLLLWGETRGFIWKPMDRIVILWVLSGTIIYTILFGTLEALKYKLGFSFDAIGMYFFFRCLIKNCEDLRRTVKAFIYISIPVAFAFLLEYRTGRNIFAIFGGVPAVTLIREGHLRCQGAFAVCILAGCFWASLMPLMVAFLIAGGRERFWGIVGLVNSILIILCCGSSTPLLGMFAGIMGICFFPLRYYMRSIRWSVILLLVILHMSMKAPVWHLISRIDLVGGSTGWHRYNLINEAINHFGEWCLLGTQSTVRWGWDLFDVTNQYVLEGIRGGLLTMTLFIIMIGIGFRGAGLLWRSVDSEPASSFLAWALGVSLFVHTINFLGISYFGQIIMVWYLLLAFIGSFYPTGKKACMKGSSFSLECKSSRIRREVLPAQCRPHVGRTRWMGSQE